MPGSWKTHLTVDCEQFPFFFSNPLHERNQERISITFVFPANGKNLTFAASAVSRFSFEFVLNVFNLMIFCNFSNGFIKRLDETDVNKINGKLKFAVCSRTVMLQLSVMPFS